MYVTIFLGFFTGHNFFLNNIETIQSTASSMHGLGQNIYNFNFISRLNTYGDFLSQHLEMSLYEAPLGTWIKKNIIMSYVRHIISYVRLIISYVRLIMSYVRHIISYVRLIISYVRLIISFVRTTYYLVRTT